MNQKYKKLFEPFTINKLEIKNKFVMCPMATVINTDTDNVYTRDSVEYYVERAKGGVGLIITGATWVDNEVEHHPECSWASPIISPRKFINRCGDMNDRIHAYGTKIFLQLSAGFGRSSLYGYSTDSHDYVAPSPTKNRWDDLPCRALTTEEVEGYIRKFGESALIAKQAGFDGVEIHALHEGYLLDSFAIKLFNQRTDRFGGDLEGRLRFATEIVRVIKEKCGNDFPVTVRYGVKSYIKGIKIGGLPGEKFTELGRDTEESLKAARILQEAGYDAFNADGGSYDSWYWAHPPMYFKDGMYLPLTAELEKVVDVPVIVAGRMDNPDLALKALESHQLDAIGLARPLLTDSQYVNKLKADKLDEIRPCLSCHDGCFGRALEGKTGSCAVNPECAREDTVKLVKSEDPKKVLVIGGGVGGMETARAASIRGHKVTIVEKGKILGGNIIAAGSPDFKHHDRLLLDWYRNQMKNNNVKVLLNTEANKDFVKNFEADVVVVATGSNPIRLRLPGLDSEKVTVANDVLLGSYEVGQVCTVVGGGLVGCELALDLAKKGKDVTIIEGLSDIMQAGVKPPAMNEQMLRDLLAKYKVKIQTNSMLSSVNDEGVVVKVDGVEKTIPCDNVILAVGYKSEFSLYNEIKDDVDLIYNIGDSRHVRNIRAAIWDGYEIARTL